MFSKGLLYTHHRANFEEVFFCGGDLREIVLEIDPKLSNLVPERILKQLNTHFILETNYLREAPDFFSIFYEEIGGKNPEIW